MANGKDTKEPIINDYNHLMEGFEPSAYINREWTMQNGLYQQYSAFPNVETVSGTLIL